MGSELDAASWAKGPPGCILSEVLRASDIDISWVAKGAGERAGVERLFQWRAAACVKGVVLREMNRWLLPGVLAFNLHSSRKWARVAAHVCGHCINVPELPAVGVLLPLFLPPTGLADLDRALDPFQLLFASRATRRHTP